ARYHDKLINGVNRMDDKAIKKIVERNSQLNALLQNTVDALQEERRLNAATKNHVPGGFYMMSRLAEKNLRQLQREAPTAALVFSVIRENMQIGTNAVTISNQALAKILGKSPRTVARSTKYLSDNSYVQIIKIGNTNTYVVNEQIAFAGSVGQRKAVFSSSIVAHECEQEPGWNDVKTLKSVPIIYDSERVILNNEELPPPDQTDLDLS
ncbi:MAG: replication/maintenance protein RepL, partial [Thiolinea sp.]